MSVYNGVTFVTSVVPGLVTSRVTLSVSDMDPIDRIDFLIVVEGSDRQVAEPTTAPPDGGPGPWVYEKTVLLDPMNPTSVTPRAYFRDGTTSDADPVTLDPMAASGGGTLEVQNGAAGAVQTATRLVFPAGVSNVPTGSETVTLDLDGHYAALEHRHPWSDIDGTPTTLRGYGITDGATQTWVQSYTNSNYALGAGFTINQNLRTSDGPRFTGIFLAPADPATDNTAYIRSYGAFAALQLQTTDGAGIGQTAIHINHATAGGYVGLGRTDPAYRLDVWGGSGIRATEPSGSKPNGTVAAAAPVLRFARAGTLNYSYDEGAEFRIGHGGPSVYGSNLELWINGAGSTGAPDTKVATFGWDGSLGISGSLFARIFYDSDNTSYYLDPAGTSSLYALSVYATTVGGTLGFGSVTRQMLNLFGTDYALGVQASTLYYRSGSGFAWYKGGAHNEAQWNSGGGSTLARLDNAGTFSVRKISDLINGAYYLVPSGTSQLNILKAQELHDQWTAAGMYLCHIIPRGTFDNTISAPIGTLQAIF